jgi:hypothetical protein
MPDNLLMLGFGPRVWLCVLALVVLGWSAHANAPGFYVSGELSATDTECEEGMVAIGQDIILMVKDKPIYDRQIAPLIGQTVRLVLVAK